MRRFSALLGGLALLALLALVPRPASAQLVGTQTAPASTVSLIGATTFPVSATVVGGCNFGASGINFGVLDSIQLLAVPSDIQHGVVSCNCSETFNTSFACFDAGANGPAALNGGHLRAMSDGTGSFITYKLCSDAACASEIGNALTNCQPIACPQGLVGTIVVFGQVPTQLTPPAAGAFTDVVNVFFVVD